jgi:hypothetical protein
MRQGQETVGRSRNLDRRGVCSCVDEQGPSWLIEYRAIGKTRAGSGGTQDSLASRPREADQRETGTADYCHLGSRGKVLKIFMISARHRIPNRRPVTAVISIDSIQTSLNYWMKGFSKGQDRSFSKGFSGSSRQASPAPTCAHWMDESCRRERRQRRPRSVQGSGQQEWVRRQ